VPDPQSRGSSRRSPTNLIQPVETGESATSAPALFPIPALYIIGTAFAVVLPFFFLGNPSGHDFEFHVLSWMEVANQWRQGIIYPSWAEFAHWSYGEARFLFYPPASWTLGALVGSLLPWKMASGTYIWCSLTASGCFMFLLARRWLNRADAIFASILYAANPYYIVVIYWRSALAELLAGCLLPLLALMIFRAKEAGSRVVLPLSLIVAAAWLTNAPSAVMLNYSLALLITIVAFSQKRPELLLYGAGAVLMGAALAGFYLIPAVYEEKWVNIAEVLVPGLRPQDNFLFTSINDPDHNRFNQVVSIVGATEVALFVVVACLSRKLQKKDRIAWSAISVWGGAAALLMLPLTNPLWQHLPKLRFVQLPWRWLLCLNVAFTLLFTVACRRWLVRAFVCLSLFLVLWGVWHYVQPPWWDNAADIQELHDFIEDGGGYEGTDEYVPAGADPSDVDKDAPQVSAVSGDQVTIHVQKWTTQTKEFTVETAKAQGLCLRLFNYPAWKVDVDGHRSATQSQAGTGEIVFSVGAGHHSVRVQFVPTSDRRIGECISVVAGAGVIIFLVFLAKPAKSPVELARKDLEY
jgi:6-pyruvoyl-tetrahydropterin synthase related domain